jgi:hypothetical protein
VPCGGNRLPEARPQALSLEHRPTPTIVPVLIALILFGVAVIAMVAVALLRSSRTTKTRETRKLDPERVEGEVYEKLYGKRLRTRSAPLPAKPPLEDPHSPTQRRPRPRDSDR